MVPICGCSFGSTTSVREVPSAPGWPGHSAAKEGAATTPEASSPNKSAAAARASILNALLMQKQLLSTAAKNYPPCDECGLNPAPAGTGSLMEPAACRARAGRHGPPGSDWPSDNAKSPAAWRQFAPLGRAAG